MLCYILFYDFFVAGRGGGLVGDMSLSHVSQLLEVPGCFSITVITFIITVSLNCSLVHSVQF